MMTEQTIKRILEQLKTVKFTECSYRAWHAVEAAIELLELELESD